MTLQKQPIATERQDTRAGLLARCLGTESIKLQANCITRTGGTTADWFV